MPQPHHRRQRIPAEWGLLVMILAAGMVVAATEPRPPGSLLQVVPGQIQLTTAEDFQSLVAQLIRPDGITVDMTEAVEIHVEDPAIARIESHRILPVADGQTVVEIRYDDQVKRVPVVVKDAATIRPVSFRLDVVAALTRAGCNNGACHGSARGQDGFHLSLFGYDPAGDYYRITREMPGRRINLAQPDRSLLLEKAIGAVPHTGGKLMDPEDELYQTVLSWLKAGAPDDPPDVPHVTQVHMAPSEIVLMGEGSQHRVTVWATYSDGSTRDVTHRAVLMTNNDNAAAISPDGVVTARNRGEALLMARFDAHTTGINAIILPADAPDVMPAQPASNYIDELVNDKLRKLRIEPSGLCSDEEFLRRASLDIVGLLPTLEQYEAFMADTSPNKRERLVDQLLERKEFVEIWVMKWAERLQMRSTNQVSYKATLLYYNWLTERIAGNVPMDQIVRELLTASGGTFTNPATNFYEVERDTILLSENVAQTFMGARMQCAQCHNHPFDRWTMDDYYGFAAFFSQIGRKRDDDPRQRIVFNRRSGEVRHPVDNRVMEPKFLGGPVPELNGRDRREVLAEWLTSAENPMFAHNMANFLWDHFFGRGIVDPVDDVRISNPPSNPQLLDALAQRLIEVDYDFKQIVRDICTSLTYQRSAVPNASNADDASNFSHAAIRRIRAEILLDCISQVTEWPHKFKGLPLGARAVQIADGNTTNYFLTTFGRATRTTVCTCEVVMEPNLSQALHLINGESIHHSIHSGKVIPRLLETEQPLEQVIEQLFIRSLTRKPTTEELAAIQGELAETDDPAVLLEDVFWALLNSKEFLFNH